MQEIRVRFLRFTVVGASAVLLSGCLVARTQHEEVQRALLLEQAAHRSTMARAYDLEMSLHRAQADRDSRADSLAKREKLLEEAEKLLAQSELDLARATHEHESATQLVDQLREEIGRIGDHLRVFADQKSELQMALEAAEARAKRLGELEKAAARRTTMVRDLTMALHDPVAKGSVGFGVEDGTPVLTFDAASVFLDGTDDVAPETQKLFGDIVAVLAEFDEARIEITESSGDPNVSNDEKLLRLESVAKAFADDGLAPGRVMVSVPPAPPGNTPKKPSKSDSEESPAPKVRITVRTESA